MSAVFKLHTGDDPLGLLGLMFKEPSVQTDAGRMSAIITLSTETEDRDGDIIVTKGIRLDGHKKNPIVVLNHKTELGVGFTEDRMGQYTVKMQGDKRLKGEVFFNQNSQLGLDAFRAVEAKILRGVSMGFYPILGKIEKRNGRGNIYHESNMVEVTLTPVGANEDAIIEAVHKTFKTVPPCAELASVLPKWEPRQQVIVPALPDFIVKTGTYKMAEPKEAVAQTRSSVYYTCPHCGEEMIHEQIFKDEDGTMRHGPCRGAVVLKEPEIVKEHIQPAVGTVHALVAEKSHSRPRKHLPRFLPGDRRQVMKAASSYTDPRQDDDEFTPDDSDMGDEGFDEEEDDEEEETGMKAGAEAHHGTHDILMQAMQFIDDAKGSVDNATVMKTLDKVSKWIGKALASLHAGHSAYLKEHPDQPPLPGTSEADGGEYDEEDDDEEGDDDMFDEEEGKERRKKALNMFWEYLKHKAVVGDAPTITAARDFLDAISVNRMVRKEIRHLAREQEKALSNLLVTKTTPVVLEKSSNDDANDYDLEKAFAELGIGT